MHMKLDPEPAHDWRLRFHLQSPAARLNDPNGLAQLAGEYHVFCQYTPYWPAAGIGWGHWVTRDMRRWRWLGQDILPDTAADASGAYSGSAIVRDGELWCYYTGNVKRPGDHDYVYEGREANEILLVSPDGRDFSAEKRVLLRNPDYPAWCSCHVRDPKVWSQDGRLWMLLGARTAGDAPAGVPGPEGDRGCVLLYASKDGLAWELAGTATTRGSRFGFMWECPNIVRIDGHEFLLICPQGVPSGSYAMQNMHNNGYFPIEGRLTDLMGAHLTKETAGEGAGPDPCLDAATFRELDCGFDFYAPQAFEDESGRTILLGWVGEPDPEVQFDTPTRAWLHTITWPRELTVNAAGRLCQRPTAECDALRGDEVSLTPEGARHATGTVGGALCDRYDLDGAVGARFEDGCADVCLEGIEGEGRILLGADFELLLGPTCVEFAFTGAAGRYRTLRRLPNAELSAGRVTDVRMVVDTSLIEVYLNGGEVTFTSRWFPERIDDLRVTSTIPARSTRAWHVMPYEFEGIG